LATFLACRAHWESRFVNGTLCHKAFSQSFELENDKLANRPRDEQTNRRTEWLDNLLPAGQLIMESNEPGDDINNGIFSIEFIGGTYMKSSLNVANSFAAICGRHYPCAHRLDVEDVAASTAGT